MILISAIYGKGNRGPKSEWDFSMETNEEQGAEMADSRSQALNAYVFFLNLNAEIYQKEIYQTKRVLEIFYLFIK